VYLQLRARYRIVYFATVTSYTFIEQILKKTELLYNDSELQCVLLILSKQPLATYHGYKQDAQPSQRVIEAY